jgi:hypothetical protein
MWSLYKNQPSFVLGFHGCDKDVGERVIANQTRLNRSEKEYDWLGSGVYFWEGCPERAYEWAAKKPGISDPYVVGAIIDLGYCLNLSDRENLASLKLTYEILKSSSIKLPENKGKTDDKLMRYLDKAVITALHEERKLANQLPYQTVRCAFPEGEKLYPGAGFTEMNHVQIAVIDERCIKGYFKPIPTR